MDTVAKMPSLLPLCLLLGAAQATVEPEPPPRAERALRQGVQRAHGFGGWRAPLASDALQEAWCLALEHHPELWCLSDDDVTARIVDVPRRDGRVVSMPLEKHLYELGIQARNAVLRDNHLNRQVKGRTARFTAVEAADAHQLTRCGTRQPPRRTQED